MSGVGTSAPSRVTEGGGPLNALLVTRRFWPLCDDSAGRLAILAEGLRRSGIVPTIVAARYSNAWPIEFTFREFRVLRPVPAPKSDWTSGLYLRAITRWLKEHASFYDLLYADCMREEGAAVVEAAEVFKLPAVVRCSGSGVSGDWAYATTSRAARKSFNLSLRADGLVSATAAVNRVLVSCGAKRHKIHRIPDGIPPSIRREMADRLTARAALAAVNADMRVPNGCRVILVHGRFDSEHGMLFAARALSPLCDTRDDVRLWFIGDGPQRDSMHDYFLQMGVRSLVAMPGSFWHLDELVRAADVMVFPSDCDALEQRLPQAISGAVPVVVSDSSEVKSFFAGIRDEDVNVANFHDRNELSLRNAVLSLLDSYETASQNAVKLRNLLRRVNSREHSIDAHCRLFAKLVSQTARDQDSEPQEVMRPHDPSTAKGTSDDANNGERETAS